MSVNFITLYIHKYTFYLSYYLYYYNSILSFFILLYCAIIVGFIFQIDFDTYDINISEENAIDISV